MNRRIVWLNLALLALVVWMGWMLRARWLQANRDLAQVVSKQPGGKQVVPPPSVQPPGPADPNVYGDVAQKTLFSKDRNPVPIPDPPQPIAAPPPPPPPPPIPPRPVYYGQMAIGEPVAVLGVEKKAQKGYHAGEEVGPFKLVAFDRQKVTLEWNGQTLEYKLDELKPKVDQVVQQAAPPPPPANPVTTMGAPAAVGATPANNGPVKFGSQQGSVYLCDPSDKSPAGTLKDGYKKLVIPSPFGTTCMWEQTR